MMQKIMASAPAILPIDDDVREIWADVVCSHSHSDDAARLRATIAAGECDEFPALQAMQILKARLSRI